MDDCLFWGFVRAIGSGGSHGVNHSHAWLRVASMILCFCVFCAQLALKEVGVSTFVPASSGSWLIIFGTGPNMRLGSVSTTMADLPLFSSSFLKSNDTIVTTTAELVIGCTILVTGCHGERVLDAFAFHLPARFLLNAIVAHNGLVSSLVPPSSGSQSILDGSLAPPLAVGFAMKPAHASMSRSTFSVLSLP